MKRLILGALCSLLIFNSCTSTTQDLGIEELKKQLPTLKDGQALVKVLVNQEDFYKEVVPFNAVVQLLPQSLKISLLHPPTSGNIEMDCIHEGWYLRRPKGFEFKNHTIGEIGGDRVTLMVGKLIKTPQVRGEGYILVTGMVTVRELSRDLVIIVFEGNAIKPGQASTPENYAPVKGCILIKTPKFTPDSDLRIIE